VTGRSAVIERLGAGRLIALAAVVALAACTAGDDGAAATAASASPAAPAPTTTPSPLTSPTERPTRPPSPSPSPAPSQAAVGTYVALGDSLAVGVGASRPAEAGYVARLAGTLSSDEAAVQVTDLVNLAVSGETSSSMIQAGQLAEAIDVIGAADPPVALVTLDIGGNDLLRLLGTEVCASAPQSAACLELLALALEDFEANYRQIVGELMDALAADAPDATLAVMTYFNPFSGTDASYQAAAELALLGTDGRVECDAADARARGMNDIIVCIGEQLGAVAVDIQPLFAGLGLELTHIASDDIHANDRGYEVIAQAFLAALAR